MFDIYDFVNGLIQAVGDFLKFLIGLLPGSPFNSLQNILNEDLLGIVNWFLPIPEMIVILESWGICIGVWYIIAIPLRWVKGKD